MKQDGRRGWNTLRLFAILKIREKFKFKLNLWLN